MPRRRLKQFFRGMTDPFIPFIPQVHNLAARIEQVSPDRMWQDAGVLANALLHTQQLFNLQVITFNLDIRIPGRPIMITEAMRRAAPLLGKKAAFKAILTGLLELSRTKGIAIAMETALSAVKTLGENGIDLVAVYMENLAAEGAIRDAPAFLNPLWNTIRYYDAEPILVVEEIKPCLEEISGDLSGLVVLGPPDQGELNLLGQIKENSGICLGFPIPTAALEGNLTALEQFLTATYAALGNKGIFLVSSGEIPADTPINHLQELLGVINRPLFLS